MRPVAPVGEQSGEPGGQRASIGNNPCVYEFHKTNRPDKSLLHVMTGDLQRRHEAGFRQLLRPNTSFESGYGWAFANRCQNRGRGACGLDDGEGRGAHQYDPEEARRFCSAPSHYSSGPSIHSSRAIPASVTHEPDMRSVPEVVGCATVSSRLKGIRLG